MTGTIITSPGYPSGYLPDVFESYTVDVPAGKRIKVEFTDFHLEDKCNGECVFDWVRVMNGVAEDVLMEKTCSSDKPAVFTSKSNKITIYFKADSSVEEKGWALNWMEV